MKRKVEMNEGRTCKKCGAPLVSTSKYKYCDNCRREKASGWRKAGEISLGVLVFVGSSLPVVKNFVNKK